EVFDSLDLLVGGPAIYDMAAGKDQNKTVLFAPSGAITEVSEKGEYYVYKYYEEGIAPITNVAPVMPQLIPPRAIKVSPPKGNLNFGPYRIAVEDINGDGYADFALTWKHRNNKQIEPDHHLWASVYSPYVSVFVSTLEGGKIGYRSYDYSVPQWESPDPKGGAQIASVAFGKHRGQKFLAAGNQKRMEAGGEVHSFAALFPIYDDGIVDNLNVKIIQASALNQKGPGIADLSADDNGNIVALSRAPFLRAPEGCNREAGEVYGTAWTLNFSGTPGGYGLLDVDGDGVPNRCECPALGLPNPPDNDADWDELIDACDSCPKKFNIGDFDGDEVDDACDNCPASRCLAKGLPAEACNNEDQADADHDGIGDKCDNCPGLTNPQQGNVYLLYMKNFYGEGKHEWNYCSKCPNAYLVPGRNEPVVVIPIDNRAEADIYIKVCAGTDVEPYLQDSDEDGIPDVRDNCPHMINPRQVDTDQDGSGDACDCGTGGAGQAPVYNTGPEDNCDNDSVPNRFDRRPFSPSVSQVPSRSHEYYAHMDTVYDRQAAVIADARDLQTAESPSFRIIPTGQNGSFWNLLEDYFRLMGEEEESAGAGSEGIRIIPVQPQLIPPQQKPERLCGMSSFEYPGPVAPCHYMGNAPREL
ncbi:MAG: thrombospondin type 3 repeat-containing protein, partial [bacterium]|nr:thrombospondin type 3 repeat-containing protein [bacterium]